MDIAFIFLSSYCSYSLSQTEDLKTKEKTTMCLLFSRGPQRRPTFEAFLQQDLKSLQGISIAKEGQPSLIKRDLCWNFTISSVCFSTIFFFWLFGRIVRRRRPNAFSGTSGTQKKKEIGDDGGRPYSVGQF